MGSRNVIEIEKSIVEVKAQAPIIIKPNSDTPIAYQEANKVFVAPRTYHIVSPDVYTIKRNSDMPLWLEDQFNSLMEQGSVAADLADLEGRFGIYQNEISIQMYNLSTTDSQLHALVTTLESETNSQFAGVQQTLVTYANDFQSKATLNTAIGAWSTDPDGGQAWFNTSVSAVQTKAEAAVYSTANLTAVVNDQNAALASIFVSLDILQKQSDGKVTSWFSLEKPTLGTGFSGAPDPTIKPYYCWLSANQCTSPEYDDNSIEDTRATHTGDTYIYYKLADDGVSKEILAMYRFGYSPENDEFTWDVFEDTILQEAYVAALNAQGTADSKVEVFLMPMFDSGGNPDIPNWPHQEQTIDNSDVNALIEADKLLMDLWYVSDYRYEYQSPAGGAPYTIDAFNTPFVYNKTVDTDTDTTSYYWQEVGEGSTKASVRQLQEALVNVDNPDYDSGQPESPLNPRKISKARSSLVVGVNDSVAGFEISAIDGVSGYPSSDFKIFADKFRISAPASDPYNPGYAPPTDLFIVDTLNNTTTFNGRVEFNSIDTGSDPILRARDVSRYGSTVIDGARITTGLIDAQYFDGNTTWLNGQLKSNQFTSISAGNGFRLKSNAGTNGQGSRTDPNIFGAFLKGGIVEADIMQSSNYSASNHTGWILKENGGATFYDVVLSRDQVVIQGTTGTLVWVRTSDGEGGSYWDTKSISINTTVVETGVTESRYSYSPTVIFEPIAIDYNSGYGPAYGAEWAQIETPVVTMRRHNSIKNTSVGFTRSYTIYIDTTFVPKYVHNSVTEIRYRYTWALKKIT